MREIIDGNDYEFFVAEYLRRLGYKNLSLTKASGDYGVDILCEKRGEKWAVQCKFYSSHVGISAVQQAAAGVAMYQCDRAMVVTNSVFTSQAKALAETNGVELMEEVEPEGSRITALKAVIAVTYFLAATAVILSAVMSDGDVVKTALYAAIPLGVYLALKIIVKIFRR